MSEIINLLLSYVGNDEHQLTIGNKLNFRGLLLKLVLYERGFKGYCSNPNCRCQTKNIIKNYLENKELVKFINGYRNIKDEIIAILDKEDNNEGNKI